MEVCYNCGIKEIARYNWMGQRRPHEGGKMKDKKIFKKKLDTGHGENGEKSDGDRKTGAMLLNAGFGHNPLGRLL